MNENLVLTGAYFNSSRQCLGMRLVTVITNEFTCFLALIVLSDGGQSHHGSSVEVILYVIT